MLVPTTTKVVVCTVSTLAPYFCILTKHVTTLFAALILVPALAASITGCAVKGAPSGGQRDTTTAAVVETDPVTGSRNVKGRSIRISFDDYVNRTIRNALSIQPEVRFTSSYSGDEIVVEILEELEENTTYSLTLGSDWRDLNGNSPTESMSVIFSTRPDIDTGRIVGRVFGASMSKVLVTLYPKADTLDTTFSATRVFPRYSMPVGRSGSCVGGGLKDGLYRMVVLQDGNNNRLVDAEELYAMAHQDLTITSGVTDDVQMLLGESVRTQNLAPSHEGAELSTDSSDSTEIEVDSVEPGTLMGTFEDSLNFGGPYLARFIDNKGQVVVTVPLVSGEPWTIEEVPPGSYSVDVVIDRNGNGEYDHGLPFPFAFAEPWFPLPTTTSVRQRWTTEDVILILK